MEENSRTKNSDQNNFIEQLFKIKNEFISIITLIKKKIIIFCIVGLLGGILGFTYAYLSKPVYTANLNFMIAPNSGSTGLSTREICFFDPRNSHSH